MRYQALRTDDAMLRERMMAIAHERRRFGYRRLHVLLRREGHLVNHKRLFRIYREEKLTVRRRGGRKPAGGTRAPMLVPMPPNDRWSLERDHVDAGLCRAGADPQGVQPRAGTLPPNTAPSRTGSVLSHQAARGDVHENVLRKWVRELRADPQHAFPVHGQMKPEQFKIDRLRREVARLKAREAIRGSLSSRSRAGCRPGSIHAARTICRAASS